MNLSRSRNEVPQLVETGSNDAPILKALDHSESESEKLLMTLLDLVQRYVGIKGIMKRNISFLREERKRKKKM